MAETSFWCVIDGYVVDAIEFTAGGKIHPGGVKKARSTNDASVGHTGSWGGFSFTKGKNAHFPGTGRAWKKGVEEYMNGGASRERGSWLEEKDVAFEGTVGKVTIIGILKEG